MVPYGVYRYCVVVVSVIVPSSSRSQQLISTGQAPSSNLTCNSFNAGFCESSKSSKVGMFNAASSYSLGDGSLPSSDSMRSVAIQATVLDYFLPV